MIRYLIDSSGLWRVLREPVVGQAWAQVIDEGAVGSCHPQRAEFRRSARNIAEYDQLSEMFAQLYPDVAMPKSVWSWIETAQYRLVRGGALRALAPVDLLICATAALHGLVVLHDDKDFATAARHLPEVAERSVRDLPEVQ